MLILKQMKKLLVAVDTLKYDGDKLSTELFFFWSYFVLLLNFNIPINNLYPSL